MGTRRTTVSLGAAAGGLLAAAFLQTATAFATAPPEPTFPDPGTADVFGFATDPSLPGGGLENVLTVSGLPPLDQQVEGTQTFDVLATPTGDTAATTVGTVNTDVSTFTSPIGFDNTEYLVTSTTPLITTVGGVSGPLDPTALPTDGSVFDTASFGGFTNVYESAIGTAATAGATPTDTVADYLFTPFSSTPIDLSSFVNFDASAGLAGDTFTPAVTDTFATTAITDLAESLEKTLTENGLGTLAADVGADFTNLLALL